jgi:hypothetical protein
MFIYAEESTGLVAAQPMGMTFDSENVPSAGYNMPLPPPLAGSNSKMFAAAAAADPLRGDCGYRSVLMRLLPTTCRGRRRQSHLAGIRAVVST